MDVRIAEQIYASPSSLNLDKDFVVPTHGEYYQYLLGAGIMIGGHEKRNG
jgi:hypothetical protein